VSVARKKPSSAKPRPTSEVILVMAEETGLAKKQVKAVMDSFATQMKKDLSKIGAFAFSGMFKAVVIRRPATQARKGINPFTKQEVMFAAKPARKVVKIRPAKALKSSV